MLILKTLSRPSFAPLAESLRARSLCQPALNNIYPVLQHKQRPLVDTHRIGIRQITSMTLNQIIGDVVDRVQKTNIKIDVKYKYDHVENGVTLTPHHAHSNPAVYLKGTERNKLYTLIMSDPDPPDPAKPIYREWLHWIVTNIPGAEGEADAAQGTEITHYMGPAPPIGTHRYAFMVFEQPNQSPLQVDDPSGGRSDGRKNFKTREFAKKYGLGDPVAATYFLSHK